MNCLIVTGLSGAGKSLAVHALEDIGFYCVDNLPPALIPKFIDLASEQSKENRRLAIVCDVRGGEDFGSLFKVLSDLKNDKVDYKILYLEARPEVLERRFKETRRRHPLALQGDLSTESAILLEKSILLPIYGMADYIIDTSVLSGAQLRESVISLFEENTAQIMQLKFVSFGFKYGLPNDADLIWDVRCLPNPFYQADLKNKTGLDAEVVEYIMQFPEARILNDKMHDFLNFTLPLYLQEGKSQLTVAVGCTGGKHRSVAFCEDFAAYFAQYKPHVLHRDISR